jgi:lipoprotein-anchoring transpeptidase ErfK/SrfK
VTTITGAPHAGARRRVLAFSAAGVVGTLALSGCSMGTMGQLGVHAGTEALKSVAAITVTPSAAQTVAPSKPLVVTVAAGRLTDVVVAGPGGETVAGTLSLDGRTWTSSSGALNFGSKYTVKAQAVDRAGLPTDFTTTLRTVSPGAFLGLNVTPAVAGTGATMGVGMPLVMTLDHRMSSQTSRAAFEKRLSVTANGKPVVGGWNWMTDDVVEYRPMTYWPGHATITVTAAIKGVRFEHGVWGEKTFAQSFRTGAAMVSYVDMKTDKMKVTQDGKVVRIIPITTGKSGFETRSGIKVIETKEYSRIMDAASGGTAKNSPDYYRIQVFYAMRLTDSGEFLHAAPWSTYAQGSLNVSHGCTGMSTSNAQWLYNRSELGDVVIYTGNDKPMDAGNGITVWNVPWSRWKAKSALTA